MPSTPSRELSITYGSTTVSPDGQFYLDENFETFTLRFAFNVTGTSESDFATNCAAARTAFRKPFQALTITQGATSRTFNTSGSVNTGLETRSRITKEAPHPMNTGRGRRFFVEITGGQPADNVTTNGLREFSTNVATGPSGRKLVTISGVVTAYGSNGARAQFASIISSLETSTLSGLGLTLGTDCEQIAEEPTAASYNDKTLAFSRTYHQIKYGQAGSTDDAGIVEQQMRVTSSQVAQRNAPGGVSIPGGGGSGSTSSGGGSIRASGEQALPLREVSVQYDAWVPFAAANGLSALASKWTAIRSWAFAQAATAAGGGAFALVAEEPSFLPDDNRISVSFRLALAPRTGVVRREFSVVTSDQPGNILTPAWTGNATSKYQYGGPRDVTVTYRLMEETVTGGASAAGNGSAAGGGAGSGSGGATGWGGILTGAGDFPTFVGLFVNEDGAGGGAADGGGSGGVSAGGGGNVGMPPNSVTERDDTEEEPMLYGIDSPLVVTRTTHTRVLRFFTRVGQPAGFAATGGSAGTP